jgi:hypothetical protein
MKRPIISAILIVAIIALAVSFSVQRVVTNDRVGGQPVVRRPDQVTPEAGQARSSLRPERSRALEEERRAALHLAGRMAGNVYTPPRMLLEGEEHLSPELVQEAAEMKARQLRILLRELGEDPDLSGTDRALVVALVTGAWLKEHEAGGARSLEQMLEIIAEVLPALPPGHDLLPITTAMGRSLEWDLPRWVDFIEAHWGRWSGPNGNPNVEILRRDLLNAVNDPELRMRVERLPQVGTGK